VVLGGEVAHAVWIRRWVGSVSRFSTLLVLPCASLFSFPFFISTSFSASEMYTLLMELVYAQSFDNVVMVYLPIFKLGRCRLNEAIFAYHVSVKLVLTSTASPHCTTDL
jgi:hypothetical protein